MYVRLVPYMQWPTSAVVTVAAADSTVVMAVATIGCCDSCNSAALVAEFVSAATKTVAVVATECAILSDFAAVVVFLVLIVYVFLIVVAVMVIVFLVLIVFVLLIAVAVMVVRHHQWSKFKWGGVGQGAKTNQNSNGKGQGRKPRPINVKAGDAP